MTCPRPIQEPARLDPERVRHGAGVLTRLACFSKAPSSAQGWIALNFSCIPGHPMASMGGYSGYAAGRWNAS
ncbi:hypothetical protein WJX72_010785 [[Myrmecia] bisecta]|uniref:Uncharacterized protein n=1 Tax=[Myrmecia] bisecta TaxID=41462 RepID=A0AAW1PZC0_9CHLO